MRFVIESDGLVPTIRVPTQFSEFSLQRRDCADDVRLGVAKERQAQLPRGRAG